MSNEDIISFLPVVSNSQKMKSLNKQYKGNHASPIRNPAEFKILTLG